MDVNIRDRRGEGVIETLLFIFLAMLAGIIIFGLFPGILITTVINYFVNMTMGQIWGSSIICSLLIFGYIYLKVREPYKPSKVYLGVAVLSAGIILLATLFSEYNFMSRTVLRMFDNATTIPYEMLTAPSEINKKIPGSYIGSSHNQHGTTFYTTLDLDQISKNEVEGTITWVLENEITKEVLRGNINQGQIVMNSPSNKLNEAFETNLNGVISDGVINCEYTLTYWKKKKKTETVAGSFNGYNLK